MHSGVPQTYESLCGGSLAVSRGPLVRAGGKLFRAGLLPLGVLSAVFLSAMFFAAGALGADATVGLGSAAGFSVLAGSTITNTGPTKMFGDLGLSPGSSVTGAPQVLGQTHVDDAQAIAAKNALTTGYNNAASRPSNGSAGTDLAGQTFLPGVHTASSSLLLSSGSVTLDAKGNPNAVFIFQIGSTLITGSNTTVLLSGGAQACNVFWQVGSSATLGTGTRFVGTVMALASITANTGAVIHGRLLAQEGTVTLDTNTITTSNCPSSAGGAGGGTETTTGAAAPPAGSKTSAPAGSKTTAPAGSKTTAPSGSKTTAKHRHRRASRRAPERRRPPARPALPHKRAAFTG
jgi:Ice-binding-like